MAAAAILRVLSRNRTGEAVAPYVPPEPNPNLLLWSEQFQQTAWSASSVIVTPDQIAAPDEAVTADLLDASSTAGFVEQVSGTSPVEGQPYTFSVYILAGPGHAGGDGQIRVGDRVVGLVAFTFLATGAWQRFSVTRTAQAADTELVARILVDTDDAAAIYAWGAKLEVGSVATAYVQREGV